MAHDEENQSPQVATKDALHTKTAPRETHLRPKCNVSSPPHQPQAASDQPELSARVPKGKSPSAGDNTPGSNASVSRAVEAYQEASEAAWLRAASSFAMSTDFEIRTPVEKIAAEKALDFKDVLDVMKAESKGKKTIQALGDKILLSQMLDNLGIPQMPVLYATHGKVDPEKVEALVRKLESSEEEDALDIVVKPTHLSSSAGALIFSKQSWYAEKWNATKLVDHMNKFLAMQADASESEALRALKPGFVIQKRYRSGVDFHNPLELRIVTLWGKARIGIWWWGRDGPPASRNTWLCRHPRVPGKLGDQDGWEVLHSHLGFNPGFNAALEIFKETMPALALAAEEVAAATGAPFLRSDFFVGSKQWGIRLNEVAYGSGCSLVQRLPGTQVLTDDGPNIARLLHKGLTQARREEPDVFLRSLGARGAAYETENPATPVPGLRVQHLPTNRDRGTRKLGTASQGLLKRAGEAFSKLALLRGGTREKIDGIGGYPGRAQVPKGVLKVLEQAGKANVPQVRPEHCRTMMAAVPAPPAELVGNAAGDGTPSETVMKRVLPVQAALPQVLSFTVPNDAVPGQLVCIKGPHGPMHIPLPDSAEPGKPCSFRLGASWHHEVMVPEECKPGDMVTFTSKSGEQLQATVPEGKKPGETFQVLPRVVMLQVPRGALPGDLLAFTTPLGTSLMSPVPQKCMPGQYFPAGY